MLTESINPRTKNIDQVSTLEMVRLIANEDALVAPAVAAQAERIAAVIDAIAPRVKRGGRLIYVGAGTSGRLGVLDASEIPPTFGMQPDRVVALIAGGDGAIQQSVEGAEDNPESGAQAVVDLRVGADDSVIGIAASGGTPYVLGALRQARKRGAFVAGIACNESSPMAGLVDIMITPLVGPEAVAGSTRMKAGTAQKLVLNVISTGLMIRLGKTFGNLMVDVQATNAKLRDRARRIIELACSLSPKEAEELLAVCNGEVKTAIVSSLARISPDQARLRLTRADGVVRVALSQSDD
jgi:N-acetylmuramic acid 6-phosphate etherase